MGHLEDQLGQVGWIGLKGEEREEVALSVSATALKYLLILEVFKVKNDVSCSLIWMR